MTSMTCRLVKVRAIPVYVKIDAVFIICIKFIFASILSPFGSYLSLGFFCSVSQTKLPALN